MKKIVLSLIVTLMSLGSYSANYQYANTVEIFRNNELVYKSDSVVSLRCVGNSTIILSFIRGKDKMFVGSRLTYTIKKNKKVIYDQAILEYYKEKEEGE